MVQVRRKSAWQPERLTPVYLMRRYLVFTYYADRPLGGFHDFLDSFSSVDEALDNLLDEPGRYFQIVDRNTMQIIRQGLTRFKRFDPSMFRREEG